MSQKELVGFSIAICVIAIIAISSIIITSTITNETDDENDNNILQNTMKELVKDSLNIKEIDSINTNVTNSSSSVLYTLPKTGGTSGNILTVESDVTKLKWDKTKDAEGPEKSSQYSAAFFDDDKLNSSNVYINSGNVQATKFTLEDPENKKIFSLPQTQGVKDQYLELLEDTNSSWKTDAVEIDGDVVGPDFSVENSICSFDGTDSKAIFSNSGDFDVSGSVNDNGVMTVQQFQVGDISISDQDDELIYSFPMTIGAGGQALFKDVNNLEVEWKDVNSANVFISEIPKNKFLVPVFQNDQDGDIVTTNVRIEDNIVKAKGLRSQIYENNLKIKVDPKNLTGRFLIGDTNEDVKPINFNTNGLFYNSTIFKNDSSQPDEPVQIKSVPIVLVEPQGGNCFIKLPEITRNNPFINPGSVPIGTSINICNISATLNVIIPDTEVLNLQFDIVIYPGTSCKITALDTFKLWSFLGEDRLVENGFNYGTPTKSTLNKVANETSTNNPVISTISRKLNKFIASIELPDGIVLDSSTGSITFSGKNPQTENLNFEVAGTFLDGYAYTTEILVIFS